MKSKILCTWKTINGECDQCKRYWGYEGWDNRKKYRDLVSGKAPRLCKRCINARIVGEYRYRCDGCAVKVSGSFEELRNLADVFGRSFCQPCMIAFFGRYDPENLALTDVIAGKVASRKTRSAEVWDSDDQQLLFEKELRYASVVRSLSRANLRRHPEILNPHGYKLGRSGVAGAYQLDHIVPVSVCWEYRVPEENASSLRNLQVIPWFVNLSRGSGIGIEDLVGWPYPVRGKKTRLRY